MKYVLVCKMNACMYYACLLCVIMHLEAVMGVMTCNTTPQGSEWLITHVLRVCLFTHHSTSSLP